MYIKRITNSNNELNLKSIYSVSQEESSYKPVGLWYSINDAWALWCKNNDWGIGKYKYELEVDEKQILKLSTVSDIDRFVEKYRRIYDDILNRYKGSKRHVKLWFNRPDWNYVAQEFSGIEINPYIYIRGLATNMHGIMDGIVLLAAFGIKMLY